MSHAGYPEEEDVGASLEQVPREEGLHVGVLVVGQPMVEKGKSPEENQVSSTSSSWVSSMRDTSTLNFFAAFSLASYSFLPTT